MNKRWVHLLLFTAVDSTPPPSKIAKMVRLEGPSGAYMHTPFMAMHSASPNISALEKAYIGLWWGWRWGWRGIFQRRGRYILALALCLRLETAPAVIGRERRRQRTGAGARYR